MSRSVSRLFVQLRWSICDVERSDRSDGLFVIVPASWADDGSPGAGAQHH
jgi:hypothetical protein